MFIYYILNGMNWQVCHLFLFAQCNTLFDKEEVRMVYKKSFMLVKVCTIF